MIYIYASCTINIKTQKSLNYCIGIDIYILLNMIWLFFPLSNLHVNINEVMQQEQNVLAHRRKIYVVPHRKRIKKAANDLCCVILNAFSSCCVQSTKM